MEHYFNPIESNYENFDLAHFFSCVSGCIKILQGTLKFKILKRH